MRCLVVTTQTIPTTKQSNDMMSLPSKSHSKPKPPAEGACLALLNSSNTLPKLLQTLSLLLKSGLQSNPIVLTKFVSVAAPLNSLPLAVSLLFSPLSSPNLYDSFLFNTLIRSLPSRLSLSYYSLMRRLAIPPNKFTFPFLLKSCSSLPDHLPIGSQIHAAAIKSEFAADSYVQNTLVHMYACAGAGLESARKVFDRTPKTSPVTWSAMISGCVRSGRSNEAVALFREMQMEKVHADEVTFMTVLSACADLGALELTRWIGSFIERGRVMKTVPLCNALVDALAKCGDVDGAVAFFEGMQEMSIVSWTSVIDGLAAHGRGEEAVALFERMKDAGVVPDDVAFIGVLTACSHAGLVNEGRAYFDSMRREFGIAPKIEHYGCMVDMLARMGLVEEAMEFVEAMPIEPNPVIWRSLIGACKVHGKHELGERITRDLIVKEPTHSSNYVLLSNVYALTRKWEKKMEIRKAMSRRGIQKVPGCSLLELEGEIFEFVAGDETHPHYKEIYEMVVEIAMELKRAGYVATTSEMLLDLDEEDKEDALHWHSEKLAIAFALLRTQPGAQIRIVKNLRVCGDCHSATKFISRVYEREILVRDRSRFHRFKDGVCSCNDFW